MRYRPEIDGLRAVAVLPVMLFHAGFHGFRGGFVGVDVFFVISGYLITGILAAELDAGSFSLLKFYERRARRILPALFLVMAACVPFAYAWMMQDDARNFARAVVAVSFFVSNILFWRQSGYFEPASELQPLLHTWSLAVEEQYYLLFPLCLLLAWKGGTRRVVIVLAGTALASLALAQWTLSFRPSAAFYLLPTRAWELLLGALVAIWMRRARPSLSPRLRDAGSAAGMALILWAVFTFDATAQFPGVHALVPTVGAALILLLADAGTRVGRLLSTRVVVWIGLISYSAYLWHQPLFAFARYRSLDDLPPAAYLLLIGVTFVLAYLSYRFVEKPFRDPQAVSRPLVFRFAATSAVLFAAAGAAAGSMLGDDAGRELAQECQGGNCKLSAPASFTVALWGDSYAGALAPQLDRALRKRGGELLDFVKLSCPSIVGVVRNEEGRLGSSFAKDCEQHNASALQALKARHVDAVVLTSAYEWYLSERNLRGEPILVDATDSSQPVDRFISKRLRETILAIESTGARVLLVTPHPRVKRFAHDRRAVHLGAATQIYADYPAASRARGAILADLQGVPFTEIDGRSLVCSGPPCPILGDAMRPLLYDGNHLGSVLAGRFAAEIADVAAGTGRSRVVPVGSSR